MLIINIFFWINMEQIPPTVLDSKFLSLLSHQRTTSLNDNAAGTSNYAAPGAHRFRITTKLNKKLLTDDADKDFIELSVSITLKLSSWLIVALMMNLKSL